MDYLYHIIIFLCIYSIITTSTNILIGLTNLLSLSMAAFYGIGSYFGTLLIMKLGLPFFVAIIFVFGFTAFSSLLISLPSIRLKGDFFVLSTIGFQFIIYAIIYNWVEVTNGPYGISGIFIKNLIFGININSNFHFALLSLIITVIIVVINYLIYKSPFGRNLKGIRDDEISLITLGKNINYLKVQAFFISSGFIGVAGLLFATYVSYIDPTSFRLDESIFILTAIIIGGTGNLKGPIWGAVFVVGLPELLRLVGLPDTISANLRQIIYGLIIILVMRYRPQGIAGDYTLK